MNNLSGRILVKQLENYNKDPIDNVIIEQDQSNMFKLNFIITGPEGTPWDSHIMLGKIDIPNDYPMSPPKIKFTSRTYHPNIYNDGKVCLSILNLNQDETGYFRKSELWSPVLDFRCVFLCIMNLFHEPNLESPADLDSCLLYRTDRKKLRSLILKEMN
jgi:ubiquitin-protein ligase